MSMLESTETRLQAIEDQYLARSDLFEGRFTSRKDLRSMPWVLTKNDLRRLYPFGLCMVDRADIFEYHESFGTTGRPTAGFFTKNDLDAAVAELALSPVGLRRGDMVLVRFPYAISLPAHIFQQFGQQAGACVIPCSSRSFVSPYPRVTRMIQELSATVICCMPTEAILLAHFALHEGRDLRSDFGSVRAICVAGEDLSPGMRNYIEGLWGVKVYDFYGATEAGNVAYSCEAGALHLADDFFKIDLLPGVGEAKELVLTTLGKEGLPLLKYRTEDLIIPHSEPCPCGRKSLTFRVLGRASDMLTIGDKTVHPGQIKDAVFQLCHQFERSPFWKAGILNETIHVRMENNSHCSQDAKFLESILNLPCSIESVPKNSLQSMVELEAVVPVGKPRYIVNLTV